MTLAPFAAVVDEPGYQSADLRPPRKTGPWQRILADLERRKADAHKPTVRITTTGGLL